MDKLLNPDVGLILWTVVTFLCLLGVLGKFAWKPILGAVEAREESIRKNIQAAELAKTEADKLRREYESQLAKLEAKAAELLARAQAESQRAKEDLLRSAQAESEKLLDTTRKRLAEEERRIARELRNQMAELSLRATEKMLRKSLDPAAQERLMKETISEMESLRA